LTTNRDLGSGFFHGKPGNGPMKIFMIFQEKNSA